MNITTETSEKRKVRDQGFRASYGSMMSNPSAQSTAVIDTIIYAHKISTGEKISESTVRRALKGLTKSFSKKVAKKVAN